jgi:syntaxin 5
MIPSVRTSSVNSGSLSHAVSRSNELISCCRTAWKIQQQQHSQLQQSPDPPSLPNFRLADTNGQPPGSLMILEEGLTLLRAMEYGLKQLQVLVRRRGNTNDPTQEIAVLEQQLEQDSQELTAFCQQLLNTRRSSKQAKAHWEFVVEWFQQVANHYSSQIKACRKIRGDVVAEQAQQRKKLMVDSNKRTVSSSRRPASSMATPLFDSPLFTANQNGQSQTLATPSSGTISRPSNGPPLADASNGSLSSSSTRSSSTTSLYYGAGHGGYGGYGGNGVVGGAGIRQRKGENVASSSTSMDYQQQEEEEKVHQQIQLRKQQRATHQRLNEAHQAETMLGELGQLFGKMSNLISQQGEVLDKIEDDVEAAHTDILAGQEELTNLYSLKKGNRPLIIKTFLVLNFLIIFMRAYKGK